MERSEKRTPSGGSRFSYGTRTEDRAAQTSGSRYTPASGLGYQNRYASGQTSDYSDGRYQPSRYSGANYTQPSRGVEGIINTLWRYRFFLFLSAAVLLTALVVVAIISAARPDDKYATLPYYTPAPSGVAMQMAEADTNTEGTVEETPAAVELAAVPTEAPKPRPTMVAEYQVLADKNTTDKAIGLVQSDRVDDSYFNDTVFVGDSVSKKLEYYITAQRKTNPTLLGNAKFLTAQSFSARNALRDVTDSSIHPTYQGQKMKLEDAIAAINPKRVYIMLGMNDVGVTGVDTAVENMIQLLKLIKQKSPNVQIFVQSATPRVSGSRPTTEQLFEYNMKMYEYCQYLTEYDIWYVDVAYVMRDAEGKLYEEYCSDLDSMALHFTNEGCRVWVEYLYTHALADN